MTTLNQLKSKFSSNYHRAVNDPLTPEEDREVRAKSKEFEDQLRAKMTSDEFEDYYQLVHKSAWSQS
jgi:hypothetical protein